ncbi:phosphoribosylanthranilate isomerase [Hufsiella ginkgonis]|uniref:N-(5'-phosphoribosyl)anthranilate isomerase n=1 Tax=Hufsiella ginkgonis TaxID=2695274 RepID=A0A7K1XY25_9SPHI|nr:phosphoribosylanthranilate isomerase [Hufsiella ginkgonis]MXV15901.1 phosphoribosylanthranilate isomerase [Hufsiella ginkgonis]
MKIKVCGMRDPENIKAVAALSPDYMGFIFYPGSERFVAGLPPKAIWSLPEDIITTGVFVDSGYDEIIANVEKFRLQAVQLHGSETPELCGKLYADGLQVIKAFGVNEQFDFDTTEPFSEYADYFLFDTKTPGHGGSGASFNWALLENYLLDVPYFLSGGIGPDAVDDLKANYDHRFYAVDLNSRFEVSPGLKDVEKLRNVFKQLRSPVRGQEK